MSLLLALSLWIQMQEVRAEGSPSPRKAPLISRKEDEILLPPFLRDYDGGILNVTNDSGKKHSAKAGEWLEFGDSLSTPDRMSLYVQLNEGMQWVAGGVFEGKISAGHWDPAKPAYELVMNRGWLRVWAKPSVLTGPIQIKTPKATILVNDGVFWLSASTTKTEVYLFSGSIQQGGEKLSAEVKFYEWSGSPAKIAKTSESWDPVSLESKIATLYPGFVKLSQRANDEWWDGVSSEKYAELREKGWRKADRLAPDLKNLPVKKPIKK